METIDFIMIAVALMLIYSKLCDIYNAIIGKDSDGK